MKYVVAIYLCTCFLPNLFIPSALLSNKIEWMK